MDATLSASPPADRLGPECAIRSPADVERAFVELSFLQSRQQTVDAATKARVDLIHAEAAKQLVIDGVAFADRRKALENAILDFADSHPGIFPEGSKTREFSHGAVVKKFRPAGVEFVKSAKETLGKIEEKCNVEGGFPAMFKRLFSKVKLTGKITAERFLRVKAEFDKAAANKAFAAQEVTKAELRSYGLKGIAAGEEEHISLDVRPWPVRSESEAPA